MNNNNRIAFTNNMDGGHWGNAWEWDENAARLGYSSNSTPAVGAIAHWNTGEQGYSIGHVAWVSAVNGDGTAVVEEYNLSVSHGYSTRTVRAPRYIHVADLLSVDGDDELLLYRSSDGYRNFLDVSKTGTSRLWSVAKWPSGLTSIQAVDADGDGDDELLLYRSSDGYRNFLDVSKTGTSRLWSVAKWPSGLTSIQAVDADGL